MSLGFDDADWRRVPGFEGLRRSPTLRGPDDPGSHQSHANDHIALVYEDRDEQFAAVRPFVRQGLERGEQCLYIAYDNSRDDVIEALCAGGIDVDDALESGALKIQSVGETYLKSGTFDPEESLALLEDVVDSAAADFEGARVAAEETWLLEADVSIADFMTFESRVNELLRGKDVASLCQYNRERFPAAVIQEVLETHPHLVCDGVVSDNSYYTPPETFLESADPERRVDRMIQTLHKRTEAEAELDERERDLEATAVRLQRSSDRLQQFAHAASHDLQEPLRMVSSYLRLLENDYASELDEEAREYIEFAVEESGRMREMVTALLAFSQVERNEDAVTAVDCDRLLERVLADLQGQIEETGAEIAVEPLPTVRADGDQLAQVFNNLVSNALTYGGESPSIQIGVERRSDHWEFAVTDDGIGIDPDKTDRIFEVFKRLHRDEEHSGTGIGLPLCQEIVEAHGGEIWVDSTPDVGSTFRFTLPQAGDG